MAARYSREEAELYSAYLQAGKVIEAHALDDFLSVFERVMTGDVSEATAKVTPVYQALVAKYGTAQAALAAQFYDDLRGMSTAPRKFVAAPATVAAMAALQANVEVAMQSMYTKRTGGPEKVQRRLHDALLRQVRNPGRYTLMDNAVLEVKHTGSGPRFARMLTGAENCDWCVMLASRGAVYGSSEKARAAIDGWHDKCDCRVVLIRGGRLPDGYDLEAVKADYYQRQYGDNADTARRAADERAVKAAARR